MRKTVLFGLALVLPLALAAQQTQTAPPQLAPPPSTPAASTVPSTAALLAQPTTNNTRLTGAVMQRLITDPLLQGTSITVKVTDSGDVTLNGALAQQALVNRAIDVVKSVPGVHSVTSMILVSADPFAPPKPPPASPPPPIAATPPPPPAAHSPQSELEDALKTVPALARVGSRIITKQILLYGTVETDQAKKQAEALAHKTVPNLPIKNIIWVDNHPLSPPPLIPHR
ncbi:MAG: BON domain-containing protein [Terriglobales bacterium]